MHPIESERLRLRAIEPDRDAAPMLALLNDPGFLRFIGDRDVRSEAQAREYIALRVLHSYALNGFGMYAIERLSDGAWLGNAGLVRRDGLPGPDVGYAVLGQYAGHGYASEAAQAVFTHARDVVGLKDLYGIISPDNLASAAILRRLGMQQRGPIQLPGSEEWVTLFATPGAAAVTG
ncbi:RimJ/RimL family protein N-acetyltransferase [Stenotrophomonas maltophilia]|uniref:GNAT family N-acetyltransferase n=1 Tax=Stenotrophomonas chelatiphaga TaxID=517011 RepID=UPI000F4D0C2E|nr:RimJ/RimL family protein N-acetyltransferase [Stenotrophomonas chelatiphaga]ROQ41849.1 RimJ/RimL family protein N-acetyltransferase [Stenotrophomonas maltophilia]